LYSPCLTSGLSGFVGWLALVCAGGYGWGAWPRGELILLRSTGNCIAAEAGFWCAPACILLGGCDG
jgi:hypothetical protein